jgi:hypothetical protein
MLPMDWVIEQNKQCERDIKRYEKKNFDELQAVLINLDKYKNSLDAAAHPKLVSFGFMHIEHKGIVAIDQTGGTLPSGKNEKAFKKRGSTHILIWNLKHCICCV